MRRFRSVIVVTPPWPSKKFFIHAGFHNSIWPAQLLFSFPSVKGFPLCAGHPQRSD
jgi:hypothetical protein